jgi:tRNA (guanine37-N1)-methyltransferase
MASGALIIDVLTIFPEMFRGVLEESILRRAREADLVEVHLTNIRDFTTDRHQSVDDRPFGGGPGMVMKPEPIFEAVEHVVRERGPGHLILLTPQGAPFRQERARELSRLEHLVLVCGRYEGFDERIRIGLRPEEISIGDYVLTGGEIPAMAVLDAVVRLLPGAVGGENATEEDSFGPDWPGLEYPQYTRPAEFRGLKVPEILRSGDHGEITRWRRQMARRRTMERRRDLLADAPPDVPRQE